MVSESIGDVQRTSSNASLAPAAGVATGPPPRQFRPHLAAVAALVVVVAVVLLAVTDPFGRRGAGGGAVSDRPVSLQPVTRQPLGSQTTSPGMLGFAGNYLVVNRALGTLTWLPRVGAVVHNAGLLYRVNGAPVILLTGRIPLYRALSDGMSGADVEQLNRDLAALGYATSAQLSPTSNEFNAATAAALRALQKHLGMTETGTLAPGQAVFLPVPSFRVTAVNRPLGAGVGRGSPLLTGSSGRRVVSLSLDAAQQTEVAIGDRVTITLPDNSTTPGIVTSIGTVASAGQDGGATVSVTVRPLDPSMTGSIDQAPVNVSITTASVKSALVVPVDALVALASDRYAVEVVSPGGRHHLVAVSLGLFDDADALVQVAGSGIAAGQRVVVPSL